MSTDAIVTLVQTLGFPIIMVGWFALRMEKRLDRQNDQLIKLVLIVQILAGVDLNDEEKD